VVLGVLENYLVLKAEDKVAPGNVFIITEELV